MTRQGAGLIGAAIAVVIVGGVWWGGQRPDPAGRTAPQPADVALVQPSDAPAVDPVASTAAPDAPEVTAAPDVTGTPDVPAVPDATVGPDVSPTPPQFDVVRVDGAGLATVAGTAPPGGQVSVRVDGVEMALVPSDGSGQFAAIFTVPPSAAVRVLGLVAILPDGTELPGSQTVALAPLATVEVAQLAAPESAAAPDLASETADAPVPPVVAGQVDPAAQPAPPEPPAQPAQPEPPAALLISAEGVQVLQPAGPVDPSLGAVDLRIDSISYGDAGEVRIGGRAVPGAAVRLYLNGGAVADVTATADGRWQVILTEVAVGLHLLRADQIAEGGKVLARFETPFKRDAPAVAIASAAEPATAALPAADPAPAASVAPITITVQPGYTLWAIARDNFGEGVMYVQVFEANRDKIKDPDLIYPGQVFTVPKP